MDHAGLITTKAAVVPTLVSTTVCCRPFGLYNVVKKKKNKKSLSLPCGATTSAFLCNHDPSLTPKRKKYTHDRDGSTHPVVPDHGLARVGLRQNHPLGGLFERHF